MGYRKVEYFEVRCDYPDHDKDKNPVPYGTGIRMLGSISPGPIKTIICNDCWDNKLTVETLLYVLGYEVIEDEYTQDFRP